MQEKIPIFPLNLVMFPNAIYPLHIFEERYKNMISKVIIENLYFGIVSKIDLEISKIGCLVKVEKVIKIHKNNSMDILVKGYKRFLIDEQSYNPEGYLEAKFSLYNDLENAEHDKIIHNDTLTLFKDIIDKTSISLENSFWKNLDSNSNKSYKLAEKSGLNIKQQQDLLSIKSENERMEYLFDHYKKIEDYLDKHESIKEIISGDGYIN